MFATRALTENTTLRLLLALAAASLLTPASALAEKLEIKIYHAIAHKDTDVSNGPYQAIGDRGDVYVHFEVTPQNGTTRTLETAVVDDAVLGAKQFQNHTFPELSVPPRPVTVHWEVRDKDGADGYHVMQSGTQTFANDDTSHTIEQLAFGAEATIKFRVRWTIDWAKLFGVVCNPEDGCLDLDAFAAGIEQRFDGMTAKYGYRIQVGFAVREKAKGVGRSSADSPAVANFTLDDRFNPASMTKTVTATALLRALEQNGISIDTPVSGFLPSYWDVHETLDILTFRELLGHHSGLKGTAATYAQLKPIVENGCNLLVKIVSYGNDFGDYQNVNYALCRVLLAYVLGFDEPYMFPVPSVNQQLHGILISQIYQNYVREQLFDPIGIHNVTFTPASNPTLFYPFPVSGKGTHFDDWSGREGYAGIQLTVREYAKFQLRLWAGSYVSQSMLQAMKTSDLGIFDYGGADDGTAYGHNGWFPAGSWNAAGIQAEVQTCHMRFANGVHVVWVMNGNVNWAITSVFDAYNEAWYEPTIYAVASADSAIGQLGSITAGASGRVGAMAPSDAERAIDLLRTDDAESIAGYGTVANLLSRRAATVPMRDITLDLGRRQCHLAWPTEDGFVYQPMSSTDMRRWTAIDDPRPAARSGADNITVPARARSAFFKVEQRLAPERLAASVRDLVRRLDRPEVEPPVREVIPRAGLVRVGS